MYSLNYKKEKVMKIKENKKLYVQPEAEVIEVKIQGHLLADSSDDLGDAREMRFDEEE